MLTVCPPPPPPPSALKMLDPRAPISKAFLHFPSRPIPCEGRSEGQREREFHVCGVCVLCASVSVSVSVSVDGEVFEGR
jgi:hypothetical protein